MDDNNFAYNYLIERGATRLCHFTKVKSLVHILTSIDGVLATDFIPSDIKQQNDSQRIDNATDYVCCSLQYPNCWYWEKAKNRDADQIFKDWVVLCIDLEIIKKRTFKFSPCNAAKGSGSYIREDVCNINEIFNETTLDFRKRTSLMLDNCPTDDQAEIMIQRNIPLNFINAILVGNEDNANNIGAILKTVNKTIPIFVSASVCSKKWSEMVRIGLLPTEIKYQY
ncbi:MAG: DarT ssDNA thymidine ADP-ribosyltransferase family protein [Oscillospiraceae bacterium]